MNKFYIAQFTVKNMWGYKCYPITFFKDVNVIIGPNASGKTTLINILYDTLTANIQRLCRTEFSEVSILLKAFEGEETRNVSVQQSGEMLQISVDKDTFRIPLAPLRHLPEGVSMDEVRAFGFARRHGRFELPELQQRLHGLVPAVWLPVSRRLPIAEEEEMARRTLHRRPLESVDECLAALVEDLQKYRLALNAELSELRKEFQRHSLENILYDKQHDQAFRNPRAPTEEDKLKLLQAFRDVGLVDDRMEARINEHFTVAKQAIDKIKTRAGEPMAIDFKTLLILPLIARTRSIVEFAQELETKRGQLFAPLHEFEWIVNSFLNGKTVDVSDRGELVIIPERKQRGQLDWRHLSSGEKQILILLTQALLSARSPLVYVADEPELSLHVTWQEKLLGALTRIAGRCQFIVATHSPDIAAGFGNRVIDLARF